MRFPLLPLLLLAVPAGAQAQTMPWWVHVSPIAGAVVVSRPGSAGRPAIGVQLEASRMLPMGGGLAAGYWSGDDGPRGFLVEGLFAYRFHLLLGGRISPFAGPVLGLMQDRSIEPDDAVSRWFFGGRGGVDLPLGRLRAALRLELSYRYLVDVPGAGGHADVTSAAAGLRWSIPAVRMRR